jgi:hypothetical protein
MVHCRTLFLFYFLFFSLNAASNERFVEGQVLVQLENGSSIFHLVEQFHTFTGIDISVNKQVSSCWNIWLVNVPPGMEKELLKQLNYIKEVKAAQLNHYLSKRNNVPNDTQYPAQYNLNNTGQNGGIIGADIKAERAWNYTTGGITSDGDTIVIAIVDEGFYLPHEDLKFRKNYAEIPSNNIDDDANGYIDDYDGWNVGNNSGTITPDEHGTHVAGIAGATGNNSIGVVGVCWNVQIMPVQLFNYTDAEVAAAYSYIFEQRKTYNNTNGASGAFIVATNSSFGEDFANPADYPLWCGMYDSLGSIGILSAGATVNSFSDIDAVNDVPTSCSSPYLITVTNTTRNDALSAAGYGATTVDLGAPGTSIVSTKNNNTYGTLTGTSMATPHVAGTIALMFAAACDSFIQAYKSNPEAVALDVKNAIMNGVDLIPSLAGKTFSGGRLNAFRSILLLRNQYCSSCSLNMQVSVKNVSCNNAGDGKIEIEILNGTPPFIYDWSNGASTRANNTLKPGSYFINVVDSNNCTASETVAITEPSVLTVNISVINTVTGESNGSATAGVIGGTPPYEIKWSDADSTTGYFVNALAWGNYSVTVTDSNGCQVIKSFDVYSVTGINESEISGLKFYPNPAKHYIYVESVNRRDDYADIDITDIAGKIIQSEKINFMHKKTLISIHRLPPGIYLFRIKSEDINSFTKLLVE